jgi:hypothetical protein
MDGALPAGQPAELLPQIVRERLLPGPHLLLQVRAELHLTGVLSPVVLVAGDLVDERG